MQYPPISEYIEAIKSAEDNFEELMAEYTDNFNEDDDFEEV